ncbi:MAG: hypothetical protein SF339_22225 [Blastocatellia bacterium]|nr:hypothetical protein [Blastocatellia bacterium]
MREKWLIALLVLVAAAAEFTPRSLAQEGAGKAQQVLAKARAALGGEKLKSLQSLSVEGSYRRQMSPSMEMSGDLTYEWLFPDKAMRVDTMRPFGDIEISNLEAVNGESVWTDQQQSGGGGGGMVMIRRGSPGAGGDPKKAQEMANSAIRNELARMSLGLLLTTTANFPVEYAFAGEAEAPEGKADVLEVKGPNGFAVRLFIDQKSNRPLMLTYQGKKPRVMMHTSTASGPPSEEELQKRVRESEAEAAKAPDVEYQVRFSEYRDVNGISLPHKISKGIDSETSEEIEFKKFKINPAIKPEKFVKK